MKIKPGLPDCREAVGHGGAKGDLLYRICYWTPKAKIKKKGHLWIARAQVDWAEEIKASPRQVRSALTALRKQGLIITKQYPFGGKNVTHVRLADGIWDRLREGWVSTLDDSNMSTGVDRYMSTGGTHTCQLHRQEITTINNNKKRHQACSTRGFSSRETQIPGEERGGLKLVGKNRGQKIQEILADHNEERNQKFSPDVLENLIETARSSTDRENLWRTANQIAFPGSFVRSLTHKQKGQLNHIERGLPDARLTNDVLSECVTAWPAFTARVLEEAGHFKAPTKPDLGYLLRHLDTAVAFLEDRAGRLCEAEVLPEADLDALLA